MLFCIAVDGIFTTLNFDHHAIKKAQAKEAEIISLGQNLGTLKFKEIVQWVGSSLIIWDISTDVLYYP